MIPELISANEEQRAPKVPFRFREFRRIVGLVTPYRRKLFWGLLATVACAGLGTLGIGAAFPIFKILLEEEGLRNWAYRVVAADRLQVELSPPGPSNSVEVIRIEAHPNTAATELEAGDHVFGAQDRPVSGLLEGIAQLPNDAPETIVVESNGIRKEITITPHHPKSLIRLLRWVAGHIPPATDSQKLQTLIWILVFLVIVVILANGLRYWGEVLIANAVLRALMDLRERLYEHTLRLPMSFFAGRSTSELVTHFVQDIQEIQRGLATLFGKFIREPLRAIFILGLAFMLDWRITLTMVIAAPFVVLIFWGVGRSVKKASQKLLLAYGSMIDALTTSLQSLRIVKVYTAEQHEERRLDEVDRRMFEQQLKLARLEAFTGPMMETLAVLAGSAGIVWLAGRVLHHDLSIAKFAQLAFTLSVLFDPLRKLTDVYVRITRSTAGAERIFTVLDQPVEVSIAEPGVEVKPLENAMEFVNVSFTYPQAERPALRNVNLTIKKGETLALVGPNGCGKTTLVSLLPRLFDPTFGEIRYDGMDIRKASLAGLRRQFSYVTQEAFVFAGTPLENITYGSSSDDRERVKHAARRASAHEFLEQLPGGFDATLGERGSTLSGGQRQRLAIARAIFRDAPILIFDEATSQIDSESERKIQSALREFSLGRTTILIAHRLSTIQFAKRVVVMDQGAIIDSGLHAELYDRCNLYRTLCDTQFGGDHT